jgi:hypothetical protein
MVLVCNKPVKSSRPGKKKMVLACEKGEQKLVHYGAVGYRHNYSKKAKKSFRARHKCDKAEKASKLTARYWACKDLWPKGSLGDLPKSATSAGKVLFWSAIAIFLTGCAVYEADMGKVTEVAMTPDLSDDQIEAIIETCERINQAVGRKVLKPVIGQGSKGRIEISPRVSGAYASLAAAKQLRKGCYVKLGTSTDPETIAHEIFHCYGYDHTNDPDDIMYTYSNSRVKPLVPPRIVQDFKKYDTEIYDGVDLHLDSY